VNGRAAIRVDTDVLPVRRFADLAGIPSQTDSSFRRDFHAVVVQWNDRRIALAIDRLIDDAEVMVKETGLSGADAGLSAGAIPLEDGSVAVLLSVATLFDRVSATADQPDPAGQMAPQPAPSPARILVVDDSVTTRSVEKSILEASGYLVEVAVDGAEALARIRNRIPDLVISDVSMPVMDGFELLENVRNTKETAQLPFILVTSLESPADQERGLSLGADAYVVKRKFDQRELLETVRQIL
jgi:two-component system chemotaxis sensor kinase CheA